MTKDVMIRLRGEQFGQDAAGELGITQTAAAGTYYKKNRSSYILYEEAVEGFREPVKNRIKFGEHFLELTKSGPVNVRMVFEENVKNMANYNTPYGNILVGIDTKKIHITEEVDRIAVQVDYILEMNHEYLADCKILMDVCAI